MTSYDREAGKSARKAWTRALQMTAPIAKQPDRTLPVVIDELAERFDSAPALLSPEEQLSYRQLADASHRYARWGLAQDLRPGDVVALLMGNCPQYLAIWLGLTRIGVTVSLLNTHLTGELLAHSINVVTPRHVICSVALSEALDSARHLIKSQFRCWSYAAGYGECARLDQAVSLLSADPLTPAEAALPDLEDRALYIYTSGTTGLPKAAQVSHFRLMQWSHWFAGLMNIQPSDRMFDCLPLYHSVGGVVATGATLIGGGAVVLRERFSARDFWPDVIKERCTLFQYIGELCRYLLNSAPQPQENCHGLRLACGNGLRAEVWEAFQARFSIPKILEYYAATEGSFSLYNCEGRPGAIGRIPTFLRHRLHVVLVRYDEQRGAPARDNAGYCIPCAIGETGEAIGELIDATGIRSGRFEGYTDLHETEGKILRNVFSAGDAWYRTGDLMRQDAQGFFYFVDRVGDTYRWKGENVSTTEVAAVLANAPQVTDAVVYGVAIPNTDGRAGMAALVVGGAFDLAALRRHAMACLPAYARPLFMRIVPAINLTGTFKFKKQEMSLEGYDPTLVGASVYFDDALSQSYVKLDQTLYERIQSGAIML